MDQPGSTPMQFDRVVPGSLSDVLSDRVAAVCAACGTSIETEYYQVNGHVVCDACRQKAEASAETPRGLMPLLRAGVFGLGAGIVGAIIYYGVIALLNLEIGIVAILIGYMVGYAVRKGARGRGSRRFQVLAIALTYASIALAYTPLAVKELADKNDKAAASATVSAGATTAQTDQNEPNLLSALAVTVFLIAALPLFVIFGSLPGGLISGFIIFIGMSQAWRMTGTPHLQVFGPYRVGAATASGTV